MKPNRQQEIILKVLRDGKWHCGREWLGQVKDDRIRLTELNANGNGRLPEGYMHSRGYEIIGEKCKGEICGRRDPKCPLFKRKAVKLAPERNYQQEMEAWFEGIPERI